MEKYVMAAGLYLLGIFVYDFYYFVICHAVEHLLEHVHEKLDTAFTDQFIKTIIIIVIVLSSFIWPVSLFFDVKEMFRKENET